MAKDTPATSSTRLFKLLCEWDVGHENLVFTSAQAALDWARACPFLAEAECGDTFEDLIDGGLVDTDELTLVA